MERLLTNPLFLLFACPLLVALAGTIAYYWHKVRRDALEASLKHEMLRRGMSADDIVKVLQASKSSEASETEEVAEAQ